MNVSPTALAWLLDRVFDSAAPDNAYLSVGDGGERLYARECRALAAKLRGLAA